MRDFTISEIENLTYAQAREMAIETMEIKEHEIFFVNLGESFGYSYLVFKNGKHIYYANYYQLHCGHIVKKSGLEGLRGYYIELINRKLYTDAELLEEVKSYDDYENKSHYLRNYYIMRYEYLSIFGIGEKAQKEFDKAKKNFPYYNPISFCYVKDEEIIKTQAKFMANLEKEYKKLKESTEGFREMIRAELYNHEACITCTADDALDALGLKFEELTDEQKTIVKSELNKQINEYY